jgi:hypothetical protein
MSGAEMSVVEKFVSIHHGGTEESGIGAIRSSSELISPIPSKIRLSKFVIPPCSLCLRGEGAAILT